jgi:hypothetical protein
MKNMPFMNSAVAAAPLAVLLLAAVAAQADVSFTTTRKRYGGASAAGRNSQSKYYFKGAKMKVDRGDRALIIDFDAGTVATIDNVRKTISITGLSAASPAARIEIKETGQTKTISGRSSNEAILTVNLDSDELRRMRAGMRMEMELWRAMDVPGGAELHDFYGRHGERIPWALLGGDGNQAVEAGLADLQRGIAAMPGIPLLEVLKVKPANGGDNTQGKLRPTPAQAAQMRDKMADLDAIIQKGGPDAAGAAQSLAILSAALAPERSLDSSGALFEITLESADFSNASIPDSVFGLPAGYKTAGQ